MSLPASGTSGPPTASGRSLRWRREDTWRAGVLGAVLLLLHVAGWAMLVLVVLPRHLSVGGQVFGVGLGVTACTLGMRHAFDADHIAAIDNTTRKLMSDGKRPVSVGFWFALGHSTTVAVLAVLVSAGARIVGSLVDHHSRTHEVLSTLGTVAAGGFLYLIGLVNLVALGRIVKAVRGARSTGYDAREVDVALDRRGFIGPLLRLGSSSITRPGQMFLVGLLFGLGFDTATEVTLMMLTGVGAAQGLPWYALLVLPLLFAAGMSLFDTLDGTFMNLAYSWAFANPVRKVYYNLTVTGLSVAVALGIGSIELVTIAHDRLHLHDAVSSKIAATDLSDVGYLVVALFVLAWALAVAFWKIGRIEQRWSVAPAERSER
ncbi:MAG: HoxN/HupN/NixA family nickel/cobalt transporter [Acidimicrobiales bacterium]